MPINWGKPEGKEWELYIATLRTMKQFMSGGAPFAFKWIEWCGVLAILRFAYVKTQLWPFFAILIILGLLLWGYVMVHINSYEERWLSRDELLSRGALMNMILSFTATALTVLASFWLAGVLMANPL